MIILWVLLGLYLLFGFVYGVSLAMFGVASAGTDREAIRAAARALTFVVAWPAFIVTGLCRALADQSQKEPNP